MKKIKSISWLDYTVAFQNYPNFLDYCQAHEYISKEEIKIAQKHYVIGKILNKILPKFVIPLYNKIYGL